MLIQKTFDSELAELSVQGALDNDSSVHFRNEIETCTREGWHRILVDLGGVSYISSAGIAALLASREQLKRLNGFFGVFHLRPEVESILRQVRLLDSLACNPQEIRAARSVGSMTVSLSASTRFAHGEGIDMEIYSLGEPEPVKWRLIGPTDVHSTLATGLEAESVEFRPGEFGFGLGTLGAKTGGRTEACGEILAVAGAVVQSPRTNGALPDFSIAAEDFYPVVQLVSGIHCRGGLPTLIRFEPSEHADHVGLSALVQQALREIDSSSAAFVILADCAGLVGAQLRRLPHDLSEADQYHVPEIRRWLSFSADRVYRRNLTLITGIAVLSEGAENAALHAFTRPMRTNGNLRGHFHGAAFSYSPLKKRTLDLDQSVRTLFENGSIQDLYHLLNDDRPLNGAGETELLSGACWVGSLNAAPSAERRA